jgi:hypothetical protein
MVAAGWAPKSRSPVLDGLPGEFAVLVALALVCVFIVKAAGDRPATS